MKITTKKEIEEVQNQSKSKAKQPF